MPSIKIIAAFAVLVGAITPATAQDWPIRLVTMVYPFAAGSAADAMGRIFASRLSEFLGQTVVFENVGGAGGMIGSSRVAKAPRAYLNSVLWLRMTLRTVARDTVKVRTISLIERCCSK